ncbi:MAG: hypothetical protein B6229_09785, partial [Spirochaetaceae bacterium 4572_7]
MKNFIWETHGIHTGTGSDHVKHGIDDIENVVKTAIDKGYPSVTFIIHTPRMTGFRYVAEKKTDIKFIRGDNAYFNYSENIKKLKEQYKDKIDIRHGIELEWQGSNIGLDWNRSKIFQATGIDFIIGSIHFSKERIAYDGSQEETDNLLNLRGGFNNYWLGYLDEMIEMIDESWETIQVVGHIDLPKLYTPYPDCFKDLENSDNPIARKMRLLLEKISEYNLALDVNLAGIRKGCGAYPGNSVKGGSLDCVTVRKDDRSLTIAPKHPVLKSNPKLGIYSSHRDQPGMLTILINALASEGINIDTAELNS